MNKNTKLKQQNEKRKNFKQKRIWVCCPAMPSEGLNGYIKSLITSGSGG